MTHLQALKQIVEDNQINVKNYLWETQINAFKNWEQIPLEIIPPALLHLTKIGEGSDREVFSLLDNRILLKSSIGRQDINIPLGFEKYFLPCYEFKCPIPIENNYYTDEACYYAQLQLKIRTYLPNSDSEKVPNKYIDQLSSNRGCNRGFVNAIINYYGKEEAVEMLEANPEKMRYPSSRNWGYTEDNKPVIFDYGQIIYE